MRSSDAAVYSNALHGQELSLRDNCVSECEELIDLQDKYDMIDLTNNDLHQINASFPNLKRLKGLLLTGNKISVIEPDFGKRVPSLELLALANNNLHEMSQLSFLEQLPRLQQLTLLDNPITQSDPSYRDRVIAAHPSIRFLDFERVRDHERKRARAFVERAHGEGDGNIQAQRESLLARLKESNDLAEIDEIDKQLAALE